MVLVDRCVGSEGKGLPCVSRMLTPPWDLGSPGLSHTPREAWSRCDRKGLTLVGTDHQQGQGADVTRILGVKTVLSWMKDKGVGGPTVLSWGWGSRLVIGATNHGRCWDADIHVEAAGSLHPQELSWGRRQEGDRSSRMFKASGHLGQVTSLSQHLL